MSRPASPAPVSSSVEDLRAALPGALAAARSALLSRQAADGHWCAVLATDVSVTADFLLMARHLGQVDEERERKIVAYLSRTQDDDGGWRIHPSGSYRHDTTIKAYVAMKAAGVPADDDRLVRARARVLEAGGVETSSVFTKIQLAVAGQLSWSVVPCIPPEMMLLPRSAPFNIYEMSYWCRTIMVPLTIVQALRRPGHLPADRTAPELFATARGRIRETLERGADRFSWKRLFWFLDRAIKGLEPMSPRELRRRSLKLAEQWILTRLEGSDGLGAIHPAMLNTVLALWMLGYDWSDPTLDKAWNDLLGLGVETDDEYFMQPCLSPVWDTALSMLALAQSGSAPRDEALVTAADWLLDHRTTVVADWNVKAGKAPAGAWAFQYRNDHYPDVDDTGMVLMALRRSTPVNPERAAEAMATGLAWSRAMQSRNGGWGAFDRNNDRLLLQHVPFADHGALLDSPTADVTGRMIELLGAHGFRRGDDGVDRGLAFLRREQEDEGCWYGRWGINYVYGTWSVLAGLEAVRLPVEDPMVQRAAAWLEATQVADGSWGESPDSYVERSLMARGTATPSQTAWGLLGLIAAGRARSEAARRAAAWLIEHQGADGNWAESEWTGTGFPGVLYLRYDGYRLVFPIQALGRMQDALASED